MALTAAQQAILEEESIKAQLTPKQRKILEEESKKAKDKTRMGDYGFFGKKNPYSVQNIFGSMVEPGLALGTGAIAYPAGLMSALGSHWKELAGAETAGPEANRRAVEEALMYQPKTAGGKVALEGISNVLTLGGAVPEVAEWSGKQSGGGHYGALTEEAINLAPALIGARAVPKGNIISPKARAAIGKPIEYAAGQADRAKQIVSDALSTRFSDKARDQLIGRVANELAGPRKDAVIESLMKAKEGETVGQAAVPSGSYEIAALQRVGKDRLPSEYGAVADAQSIGRRSTIQDSIARTPEELKAREVALATESAKAYGKTRDVPVDPRSNQQKLVEAAMLARQNAERAKQGKISALQDTGRFQTLEANQASRALGRPPEIGPVTTALTGQRTPTARDMGFIEGQPRPPAKYTPQRAVELEAGKAAAETADLAKYRAVQEKTHTNISESMLLNTVGETGASLGKFLDRPSIQQAIRKARLAAKETGTYWPKTPDEPFTVGNLQRIKREVADTVAEAAKQGRIGKTTKAERTATVSEFTDWLRSKSSDFAKAEDMFAENIQPINRMKFGQELMKRMSDNLDVKERPMAFANAIENAEKLIKDQTGRAMPLDEFLLPEQMKQIEQMKMQYARDAKLNTMSSGGIKKLNEVVGTVFDLPTVGILERTMVIINSIVKRLEGRNTTEALNRMAELGLQPKELARLMKEANKKERAFLEKHMNAKTKATVASMIASETTGEQE